MEEAKMEEYLEEIVDKEHNLSNHDLKKRLFLKLAGKKSFQIQCDFCYVCFPEKDLNKHISEVHKKNHVFFANSDKYISMNSARYISQCDICSTCFTEKGKLENHIASVHEISEIDNH